MLSAPQIIARQASDITMTPDLRRAIGLLKLSNQELAHEIALEARSNAALVLRQPAPDLALSIFRRKPGRQPPPALPCGGGGMAEALGVAGSPGLHDHILSELRLSLRSADELEIGEALALSVSPWGWLDRELDEIADELGRSVAQVEAVLQKAQQIEPAGLLARDLRECLRLQAADRNVLSPLMETVLDHLGLLGAGKLEELAGLAGASTDDVRAALHLIRSFDPKPGLRFDPAPPPESEPDILVRRKAGGWVVDLNRSTLPEVSVDQDDTHTSEQRRKAEVLVRAVNRRNETLLRLAAEIVRRQKDWLENGPSHLAPMNFANLAAELELHETTVGRLAAGRMMATPRGAVTLRALCSAAIATQDGGQVSAVALRHRIGGLIAQEGRRPLSDAQIAARLEADGILLARRTVAKYRAQLGIASAAERGANRDNGRVSSTHIA